MELNKYLKMFTKYAPNFNVGDVELHFTGEFQKIRENDIRPVYTLKNPKDVPYNRRALENGITQKLLEFRNFTNETFRGITHYIIVENWLEEYIPTKIKKKIKDCLIDTSFNRFYNDGKIYYRVLGEYTGDYFFEFNGSDNLSWMVDFRVKKITKENYDGDILGTMTQEDSEELIDLLRYEQREFFEDPIWKCIKDDLIVPSFIDFETDNMYFDTYIYIV